MRPLKAWLLVACLVILASSAPAKRKETRKHHHKHELEGIDDVVEAIPTKPYEQFVGEDVILNVGDAAELIKRKNDELAKLREKLYTTDSDKALLTGSDHFVEAQQDLYESYNALILPQPRGRPSLVHEFVPDSIDVYIDSQFKTLCYADRVLSGECGAKFGTDAPIRTNLQTRISETAVSELTLAGADCAEASHKALLFVEMGDDPSKTSAVCLQYGAEKILVRYWVPSLSTSVNYEFSESRIPQIKPVLLQDYLHSIRRFNRAKQAANTHPSDLISFLKTWSENIGEFETTHFQEFLDAHKKDVREDWEDNAPMLKENLRTAVQLFVLQEAAHDGRISWNTVERYLPQLPSKTRDGSDAGYLLFQPSLSGQANEVQRIIKNPRHRFAVRAKLATVPSA